MFGRTLRHGLLLASCVVAAACLKVAPDTDRSTYRIDVTNAYTYPMNVIVRHDGGFTILGVIKPGESREFDVRMWQAQPVRIVATPLGGFQKLDKATRVGPDCTARVVFQDVHIGRPVAGNSADGGDNDAGKPADDVVRRADGVGRSSDDAGKPADNGGKPASARHPESGKQPACAPEK